MINALSELETDAKQLVAKELSLFQTPLNLFFSALQAPGVNYESVIQDYMTLQLEALGIAPQAESVAIADLASIAQAKLAAITQEIVTPSVVNSDDPGLPVQPATAAQAGLVAVPEDVGSASYHPDGVAQ